MLRRQVLLNALIGAAVLLTPYLAVSAEEPGTRMRESFKNADKDGDGSLTREEAKAMPQVSKNFDTIDADKSGTVTADEIRVSMKGKTKQMNERAAGGITTADKDGDGALTKEEAQALPRVAKNFDEIDADKSGTITQQEINDYTKTHHQKRKN